MHLVRRTAVASLFLSSALLSCFAGSARAVELLDGRVQIHGYVEEQLRTLSEGYHFDRFYLSNWTNILNVEIETDIAPTGFGPFSLIQSYTRFEVRYECVWTRACGLARSEDFFGDRAVRVPQNFADGTTSGRTGILANPDEPSKDIHGGAARLVPFTLVPPLDVITELGGTNVDATFAPVSEAKFAIRQYGSGILPQGPWLPRNKIHPNGVLQDVPNRTIPNLPFRPTLFQPSADPGGQQGLYVPSNALRQEMPRFGQFDQNFSQNALEWNHGASQDEHELKEMYVDAEMLDGRLWMRIGKQSIVWGKTELFRTTDQFNPQDIGLVSLGSLEETRISLWAARFIYSLYDVGPLEDVRLELAANFDQYEPIDLGRCGEPYTVYLVCGKSVGLFAHGILGAGLAGEVRPPDPWHDTSGFEIGGRLEFRWDRFSFALTDFWGYADTPTAKVFNRYTRAVDPTTGRPVDVDGRVLNPSDPDLRQRVVAKNSANRQFFDVFCSATIGIAGRVLQGIDLSDECALSLLNTTVGIPQIGGLPIPAALGAALTGNALGSLVLQIVSGKPAPTLATLLLNPGESLAGLDTALTTQQQALLGCGGFYGTNCQSQGIDLFNAEASVLLQRFPQVEPGGPVATRYVNGQLIVLPGARGPANALYDPRVDGCVNTTQNGLAPAGFCAGAAVPATTAQIFGANGPPNELAIVSYNLLTTLAALGATTDPNCSPSEPLNCGLARAIFGAAGTQRPERRAGGNGTYGRRDFYWHSGAELELFYNKRNVLGFSADFAEDRTKTNWGIEATWVSDENFANNKKLVGYANDPTYNLTISVDRPTFINFLNANRTFIFNSQWFFRYIDGFERGGVYAVNGPISALGTFTILTGYFQDRLLPAVTFVHDIQSNSGAILGQMTYRFSEVFSATFGASLFYGKPETQMIPFTQALIGNNTGSYRERTKFEGLSAIAERDELFFSLRYTF